jgi:hypothetical protein
MTTTAQPNQRDREVAANALQAYHSASPTRDGPANAHAAIIANYRAEIEADAEQRGYERGRWKL